MKTYRILVEVTDSHGSAISTWWGDHWAKIQLDRAMLDAVKAVRDMKSSA